MIEQYNILDFETTGLSADYDRVIEVGVIKVNNHKIIDSYEALINPGVRISSTITSITGITNNMLRDQPDHKRIIPKLKAFVGNEPIVAHNASFDARFFRAELQRQGLSANNEFLCSLLLSRRIFQSLSSHKLSSLCAHLGHTNRASHRALGDAEATFKVLQNILDQIKVKSGKRDLSLEFLTKLSRVAKKDVNSWLS